MATIQSNINLVTKQITYFIKRTPSAGVELLAVVARRMQTRLNETPAAVTYPLEWDSEKQKTDFFASNGFGNGIPYQRTGNTKFSVNGPFGNREVDLYAPHPAGALFGAPWLNFWRSKLHRQRWPDLLQILVDELQHIPESISDTLKIVLDESKKQAV
jgi:hypothetical protein